MVSANLAKRADALKERLMKAREQVWKHVKESWSAGAKMQLELIIGCAHDALRYNGVVTYGEDENDIAEKTRPRD